jgi:hypothetical protein
VSCPARFFLSLGCKSLSVFGLQGSFCLSAARFFVLGVQVSLRFSGASVFVSKGPLCLWAVRIIVSFGCNGFCAARVCVSLGCKGLCVFELQWFLCFWGAMVFVFGLLGSVCL